MENFEITSDFIRGHIDTIILKSILSGDKHAQEIANYIEEKSNGSYVVKQATLYSALKRLENTKLVNAYWRDAPEGGRRRYFKITEKGTSTMQKQLSEYGFSRTVIDNLVDETPVEKSKPQVIQIVTTNETTLESTKKVESDSDFAKDVTQNPPVFEKTHQNDEVKQNNDDLLNNSNEKSFDEVNYKSVLSSLFSVVPTEKLDKPADLSEKLHTSTTNTDSFVDLEDLKAEPLTKKQRSELDFSDILEQADEEGYKIRISSKKQIKTTGNIFINKVNFVASLLSFLVVLLQVLAYSYAFKVVNFDVNLLYYGVPILFALIFVGVFIGKYAKSPQKSLNIYSNPLSTVVILTINAVLMIFAFNILVGTNFASEVQLLIKVILPILVVFDVLLFFIIKAILIKNNKFLSK